MHNGFFRFNDISSRDFGIVVEQVPNLNRPARKHKVYSVPGRSGDIIEQYDAWENVDITYNVWFEDMHYSDLSAADKARAIAGWLYNVSGYAELEDSFEPAFYRQAYFVGPLNIENLLTKYGRAQITFKCRPERFDKSGKEFITVAKNSYLRNNYSFNAKPIIKVEGKGTCFLTVTGQRIILKDIVDYIYIDSERQDCYRTLSENLNNKMTGSFPVLYPGQNGITTSPAGFSVTIKPNYWTI